MAKGDTHCGAVVLHDQTDYRGTLMLVDFLMSVLNETSNLTLPAMDRCW